LKHLKFASADIPMKSYVSNLRVIATFSVVLLHVSAHYVIKFGEIDLSGWRIANVIDSITRFCVPVFVMISGAVLLGKDEGLGIYLGKRLKRIILPFLFWSVVYVIYYNNQWIGRYPPHVILKITVLEIFKGAAFHLWYVFMILGLYLFVPILRKWTIAYRENEIVFFLIIWFLTCTIGIWPMEFLPKIEIIYFSKYIGYLVLGYYLSRIELNNPRRVVALSVVSIAVGIAITAGLTGHLSVKENQFIKQYYSYLSPNVILVSTGVFLLCRVCLNRSNDLIKSIDSHSFGMYLAHILVLKTIKYFIQDTAYITQPFYLLGYIFIISALTFFTSYVLILTLSKIPYLRTWIT